MPITYVGRTLDYKGKTLWEIVGNLKNFGVGRIVARSILERYPEPSYMKIVKVETLPTPEILTPDNVRKVKVWVEKTSRGHKLPELVRVERASYKADYKLIPKDKEAEYCKCDKPVTYGRVLPKTMKFPPLLRELIVREMKAKGQTVVEEPQLEIVYGKGRETFYRVAEENETCDIRFTGDLDQTTSHNLYKGLK